MFYNNINPVILNIGSLQIRYYGLFYALGFLLAYFFIKKSADKLKVSNDDADNLITWLVLSVVIGARIFYVALYNLDFYWQNPIEILKIWHGGLSFHGGLVGAVVAAFIFCRRKKVQFLKLADVVSIPLALALFFGRIANFINGELYGRITSVPWAVKFQNAEGFRHPSQIYEALKNIFIFFVLMSLKKKNLKDGMLFGIFLVLYGTLRFIIEFFREPEIYVGVFTMGQILSLLTAITGIALILKLSVRSDQ